MADCLKLEMLQKRIQQPLLTDCRGCKILLEWPFQYYAILFCSLEEICRLGQKWTTGCDPCGRY